MSTSIFFSDMREHFYRQREEFNRKSIKQEFSSIKQKEESHSSYIKK